MNTKKVDTQLKKDTQAISVKLSISQAFTCQNLGETNPNGQNSLKSTTFLEFEQLSLPISIAEKNIYNWARNYKR